MSHHRKRRSARPLPPEWVHVWHEGIAPLLTDHQLQALLRGLLIDTPEIVQKVITEPVNQPGHGDLPPVAACVLGFALWKGQPGNPSGDGWTVLDLEDEVLCLISNVDARLGQQGAFKEFFHAWDHGDRQAMRWALMAEVCRALASRKGGKAS